jgi:hypothetical protein
MTAAAVPAEAVWEALECQLKNAYRNIDLATGAAAAASDALIAEKRMLDRLCEEIAMTIPTTLADFKAKARLAKLEVDGYTIAANLASDMARL